MAEKYSAGPHFEPLLTITDKNLISSSNQWESSVCDSSVEFIIVMTWPSQSSALGKDCTSCSPDPPGHVGQQKFCKVLWIKTCRSGFSEGFWFWHPLSNKMSEPSLILNSEIQTVKFRAGSGGAGCSALGWDIQQNTEFLTKHNPDPQASLTRCTLASKRPKRPKKPP